jgi:tripartite-type tricarboxylate transporter receptor subunit TctC
MSGRLAARFLSKHLPGNPSVIVQNRPGGGGTVANNYFSSRVKPNGLTLLQDSSSGLGLFVRGGELVKYDPRKYRAIGSIQRGGTVLMVRKDALPRLKDPKAKPVVVGDTDGIRTWIAMTVWGAEYLGWNTRWIVGYPGTAELVLALRRGEIDMYGTGNADIVKDLVKEGVVETVSQVLTIRRPDFPDVPTFQELMGDKRPQGIGWQAHLAWVGPSYVDKFLMAPPGTPDSVVQILREGFRKMGQDPEFAKQANAFFGKAWVVTPGDRTETLIRTVTDVPQEAKDFLLKLRKKYGLPTGE